MLDLVSQESYDLWLENPIAIKRSLGMQRGKHDQVNAYRSSQYAARFVDKVHLWQPSRELIEQLKVFLRIREKLLSAKIQLATPLKERELFVTANKQKKLSDLCSGSIKAVKQGIVS